MAEHTIQGLMNVTMDKVRQMADANTIIGKPIKTEDGTTIIPVSRISVGVGPGGARLRPPTHRPQGPVRGGPGGGGRHRQDKGGTPIHRERSGAADSHHEARRHLPSAPSPV